MVQTPAPKRTGIHIGMAAEAVEAGQEQLNRPRVSVSALLMYAKQKIIRSEKNEQERTTEQIRNK